MVEVGRGELLRPQLGKELDGGAVVPVISVGVGSSTCQMVQLGSTLAE